VGHQWNCSTFPQNLVSNGENTTWARNHRSEL